MFGFLKRRTTHHYLVLYKNRNNGEIGECIMSNVELADLLRTGQYRIESISPAVQVEGVVQLEGEG